MTPSLIHLEHALPPLAELGLEHLIPVFMAGGRATLDGEAVSRILTGLSQGAQKRAARKLVAVAQATGEDLLGWEVSPAVEQEALRRAALSGFDEAKGAILGFFSSLGLSLDVTPASSVGTEEPNQDLENPGGTTDES